VPEVTSAQDQTEIIIENGSWVNAQLYPFERWYDGKAVLESGDTIIAKIRLLQTVGKKSGQYDLAKDSIQVLVSQTIQPYSARKIPYFEIFDSREKRQRQFYSMPFTTPKEYRSQIFFELLVEGKMTVLCREARAYRPDPKNFNLPYPVSLYHYFLLQEDGEVVDVKDTKSIWFDLMSSHEEEIRKYAKENKLDYKKKYDLASIVEYYNSLFKK